MEASSHADLFQAVLDLNRGVREVLDPEDCVLLCRTCLQSGIEEQRGELGTFDLLHPLKSKMFCKHGHSLPPLDEQFFSGVSKSYQRYYCPPNSTTVVLNGAMKVTCKDVGFSVDARIARFTDFEETAMEMKNESMVSQSELLNLTYAFYSPFTGAPKCNPGR